LPDHHPTVIPDDVAWSRLLQLLDREFQVLAPERAWQEVVEACRIRTIREEIDQRRGRADEQGAARLGAGLDKFHDAAGVIRELVRDKYRRAGESQGFVCQPLRTAFWGNDEAEPPRKLWRYRCERQDQQCVHQGVL